MKILASILSLITLSSCSTLPTPKAVDKVSTQAHYKKYTFQAITVTSPNTGYNRCFNAAEEILNPTFPDVDCR